MNVFRTELCRKNFESGQIYQYDVKNLSAEIVRQIFTLDPTCYEKYDDMTQKKLVNKLYRKLKTIIRLASDDLYHDIFPSVEEELSCNLLDHGIDGEYIYAIMDSTGYYRKDILSYMRSINLFV